MQEFWNFWYLSQYILYYSIHYINSISWAASLAKTAYSDFDHDSKKLMHLLLKPLKIFIYPNSLLHPFKLDFACKFAKKYCKLDIMFTLKSWHVNWKNATAVNLLHFECQYCGKGTAKFIVQSLCAILRQTFQCTHNIQLAASFTSM